MEILKHHCVDCTIRAACQHTFGRFFLEKSRGLAGCNHKPGNERWAKEVMRIEAMLEERRRLKREDLQAQTEAEAKKPVSPIRVGWRKYAVRHCGKSYETAATSARSAINFVRYKLYGTKPLADCPPFEAVEATEKAITKEDALARIRRMTS